MEALASNLAEALALKEREKAGMESNEFEVRHVGDDPIRSRVDLNCSRLNWNGWDTMMLKSSTTV